MIGDIPGPAQLCLFLLYVLLLWLIIVGISLGASALYLRFRDLNHIWDAVTQSGFFIAPIIVTLDMLPAAIHPYLFLWPPTPVIVYSRAVLVDGTIPSVAGNLYLLAMTAITFLGGVLLFRRLARGAAEQL
jgi:ABC-2 type transport system permease protein